jgi:hypothetical protein
MAGGKTFKRDQKIRKEMERRLHAEQKLRDKLARKEEKKSGGGAGGLGEPDLGTPQA